MTAESTDFSQPHGQRSHSTSPPIGGAESTAPVALSGCRPFRLTQAEIADYPGRYEYWDAQTEIAWELREVSVPHQEPRGRLVELVKDIAKLRGKPISLFGTADLQIRDAGGTRLVAAQADELIYLDRPDLLPESVVVIGVFPLPDVVFEVDLTTDIRERKLALYASWGIPELWVEVPDAHVPGKRKAPGLTIHVLQDGQFRQCAESLAFPTWTAREIHTALNEPSSSANTVGDLRRVGEVMGRSSDTGPEDDPFLDAERRLSRLADFREGKREGLRVGKRVGKREGLREGMQTMLEGLLAMRNIHPTSEQLRDGMAQIAALPPQALLEAAHACASFDDFLQRLRVSG